MKTCYTELIPNKVHFLNNVHLIFQTDSDLKLEDVKNNKTEESNIYFYYSTLLHTVMHF